MFKLAKPFFIKTITPMHAGSGQDLGIVDQPIQRERHTSYPKIEGSSLKGSIREVFDEKYVEVNDKVKIQLSFGYEKNDNLKVYREADKIIFNNSDKKNKSFAGALGFTDARILFFPVKSVKGTFAWITCSDVLRKLKKDLKISEINVNLDNIPNPDNGAFIADSNCKNIISNNDNKFVILEEYTFEKAENNFDFGKLDKLIPETVSKEQIVILSNDDFQDFVNLSTEVITRTRISPETGTVKQGALFTEEYLPSETIMYSLAMTTPVFKKNREDLPLKNENDVMHFFKEIPQIIQIGGNATIGKGIVEIIKWDNIESGGQNV